MERPSPSPRATFAPCSSRWNSSNTARCSSGMPRPVSQTSTRAAPARAAADQHAALRRIFDARWRRNSATAAAAAAGPSAPRASWRHEVSVSPFARAIGANSISNIPEQLGERHVGDFRPRRASVEAGDVEQRAEDFLDRLQRGVDIARQIHPLGQGRVGRGLDQRTHIEPRGVERLQKIVAGGGEKAGLREGSRVVRRASWRAPAPR